MIIASDVIFNVKHLELVPRLLKDIWDILIEKQKKSPVIILSYKSRNDEIDERLYEEFQKNGIDGE